MILKTLWHGEPDSKGNLISYLDEKVLLFAIIVINSQLSRSDSWEYFVSRGSLSSKYDYKKDMHKKRGKKIWIRVDLDCFHTADKGGMLR